MLRINYIVSYDTIAVSLYLVIYSYNISIPVFYVELNFNIEYDLFFPVKKNILNSSN